MFNAPSQKALDEIDTIFQHFKGRFPNIKNKDLYDRIYDGYCWGEGGLWITTIELWEKAFTGNSPFSVFKDWDEYFKYNGEFLNHPKFLRKQHLLSVSNYIFDEFKYSLSFRERISFNLGYTKVNIPSYSKELDALTDKELEEKFKSLKIPWWNNAYEKYLRNNKKLSIVSLYFPFIGKVYIWWKSRKVKIV